MVKKWVGWDEWYPVNEIQDDELASICHPWQHIEFTDAEVLELNDLFARFRAWQDVLEDRLEASRTAWEAANPEEHARKQKAHEEYLRLERARGHLK